MSEGLGVGASVDRGLLAALSRNAPRSELAVLDEALAQAEEVSSVSSATDARADRRAPDRARGDDAP
jgi:hypothetical protein